ncbi:ATP-binding protein [Nonomuraea sp. CA-143628]|uniref:ATP-binding protein n=1 Tax=Nonomuraea sp. CA-143628 TaxID=3239997 RepID=UPI003D8A9D31
MIKRLLVEIVVPGLHRSVPIVRQCLKLTLTGTGHQGVDEACLVVTELVTNSILHTRSARPGGVVVVELAEISDGLSRIEVMDEGAGTVPRPRESDDDACHGRGLRLVEQVSARWGVYPGPLGGSVVWAEVFTASAVAAESLRAPFRTGEAGS